MPEPTTILFACIHNAGRSQMGAGFAARLGGPAVRVLSGGSEPGASVNPVVVAAMRERGIDVAGEQPKAFDDAMVESADIVVTMGCGDACPFFPGKRYLDWPLDDPAGQPIEVVRRVRDEIERLVRALLEEIGVTVMDLPRVSAS
ncbi:MAG: arsenate reductase ArsC [Dehalococcoidia bacterium]|nr:MAG: arsenate reductase ArsC [Dehalococcoidia bacterium]